MARTIRATEFESLAAKGGTGPVYLALGDEPLLLDQVERAARAMLDETTRDFNLDLLYGDSLDPRELAPALSALPMMADRRLVIVKRAESVSAAVQKYLIEYAGNPVESSLLLLLVNSDGKSAWLQKLKALADTIDCNAPRGKTLAAWARMTAERLNVRIDDDAVDMLADSGGRLIELDGELIKASLLIEEGETITPGILQRIWGIEAEVNIWSFFDHVAAANRIAALREIELLRDHLDKQSGFFFSQIARRWRLAVKERSYDVKRIPPGERQWNGNTRRQWQIASPDVKALSGSFAERQIMRLRLLDRLRKTHSFDDESGFAVFVNRIANDRKGA